MARPSEVKSRWLLPGVIGVGFLAILNYLPALPVSARCATAITRTNSVQRHSAFDVSFQAVRRRRHGGRASRAVRPRRFTTRDTRRP